MTSHEPNSHNMPHDDRSLFRLIADLPRNVSRLAKAETEQYKTELAVKGSRFAVGIALIAVAAILALVLLLVLYACLISAIAQVMPVWLACLIVALILLVKIAVCVVLAISFFHSRSKDTQETVSERIKKDFSAFKGVGDFDRKS